MITLLREGAHCFIGKIQAMFTNLQDLYCSWSWVVIIICREENESRAFWKWGMALLCQLMFIVAAYLKSLSLELLLWFFFVKDPIDSRETWNWLWRLHSHSFLPEEETLTLMGFGQLLEKPTLGPRALPQSNANWAWIKRKVPFVANNFYVIKLFRYLTHDSLRW